MPPTTRERCNSIRLSRWLGRVWRLFEAFLYFNTIDLETNSPAVIKEEAERAMSLEPELGEAWIARGTYHYMVRHDFPGALEVYAEAGKRLPNNADVFGGMAFVERRMGRWDDAINHFRKAILLDPRNLQLLIFTGETLGYVRNLSEATNLVDRSLQIAPDAVRALVAKITILQSQGRLDEASELAARLTVSTDAPLELPSKANQLFYERRFDEVIANIQAGTALAAGNLPSWKIGLLPLLGYCQQLSDRKDEARATYLRAVQVIKPSATTIVPVDLNLLQVSLALSYAGLGEKEKALVAAREAVADYQNDSIDKAATEIALAQVQAQTGEVDAAIAALPHLLEVPAGLTPSLLRLDPSWDPLRKDPRFEKLCQEK